MAFQHEATRTQAAAGLKLGFEKHLGSPTPADVIVSERNIILVAAGAFSVLYRWVTRLLLSAWARSWNHVKKAKSRLTMELLLHIIIHLKGSIKGKVGIHIFNCIHLRSVPAGNLLNIFKPIKTIFFKELLHF